MNLAHLAASPFFGGPERQMLGLGLALRERCRSTYLSFAERGHARPFLEQLARNELEGRELRHNFPHLPAAIEEVANQLKDIEADVLLCHGYKADLIGWRAARRLGIPVVSVSRGWTSATWKVRCYEWFDRLCLFALDAIVCVSEGQAARVRRLGVPARRVHVIRNAINVERFRTPRREARTELERLFPTRPGLIVGAAGRFSPEKGFPVLVDAAIQVCRSRPECGFVLFGEGPERGMMEQKLAAAGMRDRILLPGFRSDLDAILPGLDGLTLPSYTEGLPNIALEGAAVGVPLVATCVGGTPEIVRDGLNGLLVPPGDSAKLADSIVRLLADESMRRRLGERGRVLVREEFSFAEQANRYVELVQSLIRKTNRARRLQTESAPFHAKRGPA